MTKLVLLLLTLIFLNSFSAFADEDTSDFLTNHETGKKVQIYQYGYIERDHSMLENAKNIGILYGVAWIVYPVFQPKVFKGAGGWNEYKRNFGQIVFDKDEPIWNFLVHPLTGSQLYLLFRADGYTRMGSFGMTAITSALFEFTVEILTEPASVQDLYQTPVFGSVLGLGIEKLSLYALNSGSPAGKFFGHLINPSTLFPFYEGRTLIIPKFEQEDKGAMLQMQVNY